jgi:hypothetical protein
LPKKHNSPALTQWDGWPDVQIWHDEQDAKERRTGSPTAATLTFFPTFSTYPEPGGDQYHPEVLFTYMDGKRIEGRITFMTHNSRISSNVASIIAKDYICVTDTCRYHSNKELVITNGAEGDILHIPFSFFVRTSGHNSASRRCGGRHDDR